jgi:hypothetical protein
MTSSQVNTPGIILIRPGKEAGAGSAGTRLRFMSCLS